MAFDQDLADRIQHALAGRKNITSKKMFGGIGFLLGGNMLVGVWKNSLVVRLDPDEYEDALMQPHVREFDITGRPMKGWVLVDANGVATADQVSAWVARALAFVRQLPAK